MNPLQRAKSFVAGKATKIALLALPLAALTAIPTAARATVLSGVNFGTGSCSVLIGAGSCSNTQTATQGGLASANWIGVSSGLINSNSSGGSGFVELRATGSAGGSFSSTVSLPVSWDFFINDTAADSIRWDLLFSVDTNSTTFSVAPFGFDTAAGISEIKGSANIPIISPQSVIGYTVQLTVGKSTNSSFTVTVPGGATLDLNPATVTPEPSGLLLAAAGVAGLLWRRKKSQSIA